MGAQGREGLGDAHDSVERCLPAGAEERAEIGAPRRRLHGGAQAGALGEPERRVSEHGHSLPSPAGDRRQTGVLARLQRRAHIALRQGFVHGADRAHPRSSRQLVRVAGSSQPRRDRNDGLTQRRLHDDGVDEHQQVRRLADGSAHPIGHDDAIGSFMDRLRVGDEQVGGGRADQVVSHAATASQTGCHEEDARNQEVESGRPDGQWSEW